MRTLVMRMALPALVLAIALMGLRLATWALWVDLPPGPRTAFMVIVLALLALALTGSAIAPDGARHRSLIAWVTISASVGGVTILNRDYADWQYQRIWGAAPSESALQRSPRSAVQLTDGAIVLERQFNGHFYIDSEINGSAVNFLIDTGATGVALAPADARNIGIRTDQLDFVIQVSTASGRAMAAPVTIRTLALPGRTFQDVPALVMQSGDQSLLGMTVLERFEAIEIRRDQLVLRP